MKRKSLSVLAAGLSAALVLSGCGRASDTGDSGEIAMWTDSAGNPGELAVYQQIIADFNASQSKYKIVQQNFPQGSHNEAITAAATARKLPCPR